MLDDTVRILVVGTDERSRAAVKGLLADVPGKVYSLDWSAGYERSLKTLRQNEYDLCLVEMDLGLNSGVELLDECRAAGCTIPFILLTERSEREADMAAMRAGAADYLIKDQLTPVLLERSVRYAVEHHRAYLALEAARNELEVRVSERTAELSRANGVLQELNTRNTHILESITDSFFALDKSWRFTYVNASAEKLLGKTRKQLLGGKIWELFPQSVGTAWYGKSYAAMENMKPVQGEEWDPAAKRWLSMRIYPSAEGLSIFIADVTERKDMEERMRRQTLYDSLTDLPNRSLFEARLTQSILNAKKAGGQVGVLFLDFDRFKTINDTLGHAKGDAIIQQAALRLRQFEKEDDMVARFGGDEFLIMVNGVRSAEHLAKVAEQVQAALREPFTIDRRTIHVNASIGIATFPSDGDSVEALIKNADTALYRSKEIGRNTYRFYAHTMHFKASEDLTLENDLRSALDREEFTVYYQPIVNIKDGSVVRAEALLRWNHPEFGVIFPNEFIPLAEEIGLIVQMGEWALRKVCDQLLAWEREGAPFMTVAFNISPRQFAQPDFCDRIDAIIKEKGVRPGLLQVEITESMAMHNVAASIAKLAALKDMGIQVSVDDFGTGHSSLSYLKQLPIDRVKIDKSFTKNCVDDSRDAAIVSAIVSVANTLGLTVCAEGIESKEQLDYLCTLDCEAAQGFLFSKSVPPDAFMLWVREYAAGKRKYNVSAVTA